MIRVVFLAQLREQLGVAATDVSAEHVKTLGDLKAYLVFQNPTWEAKLLNSRVLIAVNHCYVKGDHLVLDGDEVAFFPPVTGG